MFHCKNILLRYCNVQQLHQPELTVILWSIGGRYNSDVLDVSGERPYIRVSGWVARGFAFRYRVKDTINGDVYIHLCGVCVSIIYSHRNVVRDIHI